MAATDAEFQSNAGSADQLPYGAASQLNAALPTTTPSAPAPPPAYAGDTPTEPASTFTPGADTTSQILFGDSDPSTPWSPEIAPGRLPSSIVRQLPMMRAAASEPGAPAALRAVYTALVNSLEGEIRG